jgi:hypothetical protein
MAKMLQGYKGDLIFEFILEGKMTLSICLLWLFNNNFDCTQHWDPS